MLQPHHCISIKDLNLILTFWKASSRTVSMPVGVLKSNMAVVSFSSGMTLNRIRVAMKSEQMGSAMFHPKFSINSEETMTPTLPIVSANTCRKTPAKQQWRDNWHLHYPLFASTCRKTSAKQQWHARCNANLIQWSFNTPLVLLRKAMYFVCNIIYLVTRNEKL